MPHAHRNPHRAVTADAYLAPDVPGVLPWHEVPLVKATALTLAGYGSLVDDYRDFPIEIARELQHRRGTRRLPVRAIADGLSEEQRRTRGRIR